MKLNFDFTELPLIEMAILAHLTDPPVTFIDHMKYLNDLYKNDVGYKSKDIFDIHTPFRMDLEAEKIAQNIKTENETSNSPSNYTPTVPNYSNRKAKRKRKQNRYTEGEFNELQVTSEYLSKSLSYLKDFRPELFGNYPSAITIRENNRPLRHLVQTINNEVDELECPDQDENFDRETCKIFVKKGAY